MEDNNNNWFNNPLEQGFSVVYGISNNNYSKNEKKEANNTNNNYTKNTYNHGSNSRFNNSYKKNMNKTFGNISKYESKNSNENSANKTYEKSFLNKKRKKPETENEYITEIRRLMKEGGLENKYLFKEKKKNFTKYNNNNYKSNYYNKSFNNKKFGGNFNANNSNTQHYNNNQIKNKEKKEEIKYVKPIQQLKSLHEWYEKLNLIPFNNTTKKIISPFPYDDNNITSNVKYLGNNCIYGGNENVDNNYNKYYIYLREQSDFEPLFTDKKNYEWNVTILSDSFLIGIGLADKNMVIKNNHLFLNDDESFNNGVFCMISTYNKEFNLKEIRPWHCDDKNLANHVANFPHFKKGRKIKMIYNSNNLTLEFISKKHSYKMINVFAKENDKKKILTPCIVFYYSGDEVQFSQLNIENSDNS